MGSKNIIIPVGGTTPAGTGFSIIPGFKYIETQVPIIFDISEEGYYYAVQTNGRNITQNLPKISTLRQGFEIYIELLSDNNVDTMTFAPYQGDVLNGTSGNMDFNGKGFKGILKVSDVGWIFIDLEKIDSTTKIPIFSGGTKVTDDAGAFYFEGEIEAYPNPNLSKTIIVRLKPGIFEPIKPDSYLVYLQDNVELIAGKVDDIWHDRIKKNVGDYIQLDRDSKSIGIEEQDFIDPNISDGTHYLVAWSADFEGNASYDFYITMMLRDKLSNDVILDINGNPCMVTKYFAKGDVIEIMELRTILRAKGQQFFKCSIETNLKLGDLLKIKDSTQGTSELLVQTILPDYEISEAMNQYQIDTGTRFNFGKVTIEDLFDTNYTLSIGEPEEIQLVSNEHSVDGTFWNVFNDMIVSVKNKELTIKDYAGKPIDFEFGKVSDREEAFLLRGKNVVTNTIVTNPNSDMAIVLLSTKLKDPVVPTKFITKFTSDSDIEIAKDWDFVQYTTITKGKDKQEDITTFTMPDEMERFVFVLLPFDKVTPNQITIKQFKFYADPIVSTYFMNDSLHGEKKHYISEERRLILSNGIKNTALRYTINSKDTMMPLGFDKGGEAKISVIPRVGQVYKQETWLKADKDGVVKIKTSFNFYRGEKAIGEENLTIFFAKKNGDNWDPLIESQSSITIHPTAKGELSLDIKQFKIRVKAGDILALFARTTHDDGAYIQAYGEGENSIVTNVYFDEII